MAGNEEPEEEPALPLKCLATELPIPEKDAAQHGVLFVFVADAETPYGAAVLSAALNGEPNTALNGAIIKDAKTIRLTLTRDNPDDNFRGWSYQCVESFK